MHAVPCTPYCVHFPLLKTHSTITRIIFESETWEDPTYQWIHFTEKLSPIEWRNEAETVPFEEMHKATAALRSRRPIEWVLLVPTAYSGAMLYDLIRLICCGLGRYAVVCPGHRFGYMRALSRIISLSALICVCVSLGACFDIFVSEWWNIIYIYK